MMTTQLPRITDKKLLETLNFFIDNGWYIEVLQSGRYGSLYQCNSKLNVIFLTVVPEKLEMRLCYNYDIRIGAAIRDELGFERNKAITDRVIYVYKR